MKNLHIVLFKFVYIIIIIIIIIISFMQGIYTYIPEINDVPRECSVATILLLLFVVLMSLVSVLNLLYFYLLLLLLSSSSSLLLAEIVLKYFSRLIVTDGTFIPLIASLIN